MKSLMIFLIIFLSNLGSWQVLAQEGINSKGGIGLVNIISPNTVGQNGLAIGMLGRFTEYNKLDPRQKVAEFFLSGTYGINKHFDFSLLFPYGYISSENSGIENIVLSLKYNLLKENKFAIAVNPTFYLPTGKKENNLGSGSFGFQMIANLEIKLGMFDVPINLGFGWIDYFDTKNKVLTNTEIFTLGGGIVYQLMQSFTVFIESTIKRIFEFHDEGINFQLGGIFLVNKSLLFKGSAGMGILNDVDAVADIQSTVGLTYLFN